MTKSTATEKAKASAGADQAAKAGFKLNGEAMPDPMPSSVKLTAPYAFLDEDGGTSAWAEGQLVDDPADILILIERDAPVSFD